MIEINRIYSLESFFTTTTKQVEILGEREAGVKYDYLLGMVNYWIDSFALVDVTNASNM